MGVAAKPLCELGAGQIFFLDQDLDTPYALLMDHSEGRKMLGYDPPSLPIMQMRRTGNGYHPNRNGLVLGSNVIICANGDNLDMQTVRAQLLEIVNIYERNYRVRMPNG